MSAVTVEPMIATAELLRPLVADQVLLYTKVRNYHWNVAGGHFFALHAAFEEIYEGLADDADEVAERIRALGARAPGLMASFIKYSHLKEESEYSSPGQIYMVKNLVSDFQLVIKSVREAASKIQTEFNDDVTAGMLFALMMKYEKTAWMLNAAVEEEN